MRARLGVVGHLLDLAAVDDEADAVDRHRRLADVRRKDALAHALGRDVEHLLLLF